jgi:hydroxypyruvate isomerase
MRIKQSVVLPLFADMKAPLGEFFKEIRAIGYPAVEIWGRDARGDWKNQFETARIQGLIVSSMGGHGALGDGLNKRENHDRIEAELRESIDIAAEFRIPGVICFSGNRNAGQSDYEGLVTCAQGLKRIAPYAQERGVNLNVELLNSKIDHYNYQADHTDWGIALCEMVNSPRVKLLFDIYHMQIMEGDVIRNIRKAARHIGHFHTAGNPGRNDLDDTQEMNYRGICRAIAGTGYDLFVGHEYRPKGETLASLRQAFVECDQSA